VYVVSAVAGLADVDSPTLSAIDLARRGLDARVAIAAILIALASNTIAKLAMATFVAGRRFGARVAAAFATALAAGAIAAVLALRG
jgi:uncharacterized membrane protein (DUF4010 family)